MKEDYLNSDWRIYDNNWLNRKLSGKYSSYDSSVLDDYKKIYLEINNKSYYKVEETAEERKARLLKEKAIERNVKIDKLLGDGGL